jgi:hypothetical protein
VGIYLWGMHQAYTTYVQWPERAVSLIPLLHYNKSYIFALGRSERA